MLLAVVHGETSTGSLHPLAELGAALGDRPDLLLTADCVTTSGGTQLDVRGWRMDGAYPCTQKCVGAPRGMSPISVSAAGMERLAARDTPVPFPFDLQHLHKYWVDRPPTYHHAASILHIYAVLRETLLECVDARCARLPHAGMTDRHSARDGRRLCTHVLER